jgi:3-deoxy-7-phosphoheptulonate synthase
MHLSPEDETAGLEGASRQAWAPGTWRAVATAQQPGWDQHPDLASVQHELSCRPGLVFAGEVDELTRQLAAAGRGEAFVLQAGDCAESFRAFTEQDIQEKLRVILQMTVILAYSAGVPVVKVGRMAGQFGKPRSKATETRGGVELPSFRGHIVNDDEFTADARTPDPRRMLQAYTQSATTLNLIRASTQGGFASLEHVQQWNQDFVEHSSEGDRFRHIADNISAALRFMHACGLDDHRREFTQADMYTSHEALVLDYEEALCRRDTRTGTWLNTSAHTVWIGERTRQTDGGHVTFCSGIANPVGVKLGPDATGDEAVALCEALNPTRAEGRLSFITRMGARHIRDTLPPIIDAVEKAGMPVVWLCDPMHANTTTTAGGHKTRHFDDILDELTGFFDAHRRCHTIPGGVHVELTGGNVTECLGGADDVNEQELHQRYETMCDPRLNASQSIELAFRASKLLAGLLPARVVTDAQLEYDQSPELQALLKRAAGSSSMRRARRQAE